MPPVKYKQSAWSIDAPISESRSGWTDFNRTSSFKPKRKKTSVSISAWGNDYTGAGYSENLIYLLDGGANFVRLYSNPVQWFPGVQSDKSERNNEEFNWYDGATLIDWDVTWLDGTYLECTVTGTNQITITGLPANQIVARPAEYVTVYPGGTGEIHRVFTVSKSNAAGVAVITLFTTPTGAGRVSLGDSDTGIFRVLGIPYVSNTAGNDYTYDFSFIEVLSTDNADIGTEYPEDYWIART